MGFAQGAHYITEVARQTRPPKAAFSVDQIPDLTGRVCIVTGACISEAFRTVLTVSIQADTQA